MGQQEESTRCAATSKRRRCERVGHPPGVNDEVAFHLNNPRITVVSVTGLKVAEPYTRVFHELAEAYEKIDAGKSLSYTDGHTAAVLREDKLRDQRPALKEHNPGSGGPANTSGYDHIIIRP
jgi:hypothetical protein